VGSTPIASTNISKPGHAPGFFLLAKYQPWWGLAGGTNFADRRKAQVSPCWSPELCRQGDAYSMNALFDQEAKLFIEHD
jgi:hypothetical protein